MRCRYALPLTIGVLEGGNGRNSAGPLRLTAMVRSVVSLSVGAIGTGFTKAPSRSVRVPCLKGVKVVA